MPTIYRLSMYQTAAILGSFWLESKVNPYNYHWNEGLYTNDCGWGLGMWTDAPYPYNTTYWIGEELKTWMNNHGYDWWDGTGQIECLFADELNIKGTYYNRLPGSMWLPISASEFPEYAYMNTKYPNLTAFWNDTENTNLEELTRAWFLFWETPGTRNVYNLSWDLRWGNAQRIFAYLQQHGDDVIPDGWYYEQGDLHRYVLIPDQKAYDNCVVFWQIVGSGVIPPGPTPTKKKGMPLWMKLRYF